MATTPDAQTILESLIEEGFDDSDIIKRIEDKEDLVALFRKMQEERKAFKDLGRRLLEWAANTGGWESPIWQELQAFVTGSALGFYWDRIGKELKSQPWEQDEEGSEVRRLYIGTIMSLTPSGKVYTPWANSNVEVCENCANASDAPCDETSPCNESEGDPLSGHGHCEVCRDAAWRQRLEQEADEHGYYIEHGEGDPCDMFVCECQEVENDDEERGEAEAV